MSLLIPDCLFSLGSVSFGVPVSCGYCTASAEELLLAKNGYFGGLLFTTDLPLFLEPELHNLIKISSRTGKGQTWADKRRGSVVAFFSCSNACLCNISTQLCGRKNLTTPEVLNWPVIIYLHFAPFKNKLIKSACL